jgi:DNA-binding transcriptional MerR regulator
MEGVMQMDLLPTQAGASVGILSASHGDKSPEAFKTISEAADMLGVPQHVLRFWESRFTQIKPLKLRGGRRYYRPEDMAILTTIKNLLYKQGYTIEGAKKAFGRKDVAVAPETMPVEAAAPVAAPAPAAAPKRVLSDKQQAQLSIIRLELMGMREKLKPYII